jgi:hypothetical protein
MVQKLIDLLGSVAMYNDKGFEWRRDSAEQIAQFRRDAQDQILALVAGIGDDRFPAPLLAALKDGRAVQDGSGCFQDEMKRHFA